MAEESSHEKNGQGPADQLPEDLAGSDRSFLQPLPQPGRRGSGQPDVPFDPSGYTVLRQLDEVENKPEPQQGVLTPGQIADARRKKTFIPRFSSLESMFAANPMLVTDGKLRIERLQPSYYDDEWGAKTRVSGIIAFKHPIIDDQQFAQTFGGYKYRVFGLLDQENRENKGGPPKATEVAVAEIELPMPPNLYNLPVADAGVHDLTGGADPMYQNNPYGRRPGSPLNMGYPQPGAPAGPDLNNLLTLADRLSQRNQSDGVPPQAWEVLGRQGETYATGMREAAERNVQMLADQNARLQEQLERERGKPSDTAAMVDGMARLVQSTKGTTDSESARQMRDDHERAVSRLHHDHEQSLARLREESDRTLGRIKEEADRTLAREREHSQLRMQTSEARIKDLETLMAAREREWKDEAERRESRAREEMTRMMDMREREHDHRLAEVKDAQALQLTAIREMHEREVRLTQTVQSTSSQTSDKAHEIEMRSLQTEVAKAMAELSAKTARLERFEAEKNKPLVEQLEDHRRIGDAVQRFAGDPDDDDDDDKKVGPEWWNSTLAKTAAAVLMKEGAAIAPAAVQALKDRMKKPVSEPDARRMPPMGPAPQRVPSGLRGRAGLPVRKRNRMSFADADGPALAGSGFSDYLPKQNSEGDVSGIKSGAPKPFDPGSPNGYEGMSAEHFGPSPIQPEQQAPSQSQVRPRAQQPQQPASQPQQQPRGRMADQPPRSRQPAQQPAAETAEDWSAFGFLPMQIEQTKEFLGQMNAAITAGHTAPQLAQSFLQTYPVEVIAEMVGAIDMPRLIGAIRECPHTRDLVLASGKGRRFLSDTWDLLQKSVDEAASSEPQQQPKAADGEPEGGSEEEPASKQSAQELIQVNPDDDDDGAEP